MVEKIKGFDWKLIVYLAGIIFLTGVYITTIKANSERITKIETKSNENKEDIIGIKKDITYIREGIDEIKKKI